MVVDVTLSDLAVVVVTGLVVVFSGARITSHLHLNPLYSFTAFDRKKISIFFPDERRLNVLGMLPHNLESRRKLSQEPVLAASHGP